MEKFFDTSYLNGEYADCYYTENVDIIDESNELLNVDAYERQYLCSNESTVTRDLQHKPAKGLESVIARFEIKYASTEDETIKTPESSDNAEPSDNSQKGIFYNSTVTRLAEEIIAKSDIVSKFKICIIGIHCVVSISRFILEFEKIALSTHFKFLIVEYSQKKNDDLKALLAHYGPLSNIKVKFMTDNFLFVPNNSFQKFNLILCFLNQSSTRIFALKFILLRCYCSPQRTGLQNVLCSQRVITIN